ncbi:hypothetical protein Tco_1090691 [Tanacetum coccineum]|uniref:Uncharacterized protein n=1 Tax=Tanacetum coccineum TaxID=301880 RepID=A0ABQ5I511_9ASTR
MQMQESKIDMGKAVDVDLVVTESKGTESEVQDDNNSPGNDTDADDADIRPIYDEESMAECTKLMKEVNSMLRFNHTVRTVIKPVDQKSHTQKPGRQIFTRHSFSPNKTSTVYEKTSPRSDLRWKPTGRICKSIGLRWIPTGKLFDFLYKQKEQSLDLSVDTLCNVNKENLRPRSTMSTEVPTSNMIVMTLMPELESLFGPLFDEYFNGENQVVLKSSAVPTADASDKRQ